MDAPAPRLLRLRLPQTDRPTTWSVLGSVCAHAALVFLIVWVQTRPVEESGLRRPGAPGNPGGGGGIRFIQLDAPPPAAQQAAPVEKQPEPAVVPPPVAITMPLRKLDLPLAQSLATQAGVPAAASGGAGGGLGPGLGQDTGAGMGGEGGDIFPPQMKYTILPPLPRPAALRGRPLEIHFWVNAEGRVTRVKVDPEIRDAAYRAQLYALLREYVFEPARKLDGTRVAGETTITITL
jgi:hypothetical protein